MAPFAEQMISQVSFIVRSKSQRQSIPNKNQKQFPWVCRVLPKCFFFLFLKQVSPTQSSIKHHIIFFRVPFPSLYQLAMQIEFKMFYLVTHIN